MPEGSFNIAVAKFTPAGKTVPPGLKDTSQQLSEWVFLSLKNLAPIRMPDPNYALCAPADVGALRGLTAEERRVNASRLAQKQHIDVLVRPGGADRCQNRCHAGALCRWRDY
jgi:hypothetical protein